MIALPFLILILVLALCAPRKPMRKSKHAEWAAHHRRRGGIVTPATAKRKAQRIAQREATAAAKAELRARYEAAEIVAEEETSLAPFPEIVTLEDVLARDVPLDTPAILPDTTPAEPYGPPWTPVYTGCPDHPAKRSGYCSRCADLEDAE